MILRAMRAGAREFITLPISIDEMLLALIGLQSRSTDRERVRLAVAE